MLLGHLRRQRQSLEAVSRLRAHQQVLAACVVTVYLPLDTTSTAVILGQGMLRARLVDALQEQTARPLRSQMTIEFGDVLQGR